MASLMDDVLTKILKIMLLCILSLFLTILLPFKMEFKADAINYLLYVLSIFAILFAVSDYIKSILLMRENKNDR